MRPYAICIVAAFLAGCGDPHAGSSGSSGSRVEDADGGAVPATQLDRRGTPVAVDNSGINKRDGQISNVTPLDQGGSESDRAVTAAIRKAVVAEPGLSVDAQNVKIITIDGTVSLRGPVDSEVERVRIAEIARTAPGVHGVDNQLDVKRIVKDR